MGSTQQWPGPLDEAVLARHADGTVGECVDQGRRLLVYRRILRAP